eukprot:1990554-Amphidinium_carterae.1
MKCFVPNVFGDDFTCASLVPSRNAMPTSTKSAATRFIEASLTLHLDVIMSSLSTSIPTKMQSQHK